MGVSFKVSKKGTRFHPKPKPQTPAILEDKDAVDAAPQFPKNHAVAAILRKPTVDVTEDDGDDTGISDTEVSFYLDIFPDGYSIRNPSEVGHQTAVQDDPKSLHPYDRTSESLFSAIECGRLPADFLDDIPCKYIDGKVVCVVRDYRNCTCEPGVNGPPVDASPTITNVCLKMSLENVIKDIPLISDDAWTYGDLMEAESRILKVLQPKLCLDPTPNLDKLYQKTSTSKLNLNLSGLCRKRLRQMSRTATASDSQIQLKKVCMDRVPENSICRPGDSGSILHQPDLVNLTPQSVGVSNMLASRPKNYAPGTSVPASPSLSHQSKYQIGVGNPRLMQDASRPVFSSPGASPGQDMINSYTDGVNSNTSFVHGKRENQDVQLSPMGNSNKRARSNPLGLDGSQQQQITSHMDGFNAPDSNWKKTLVQQQSIGRGIQYANSGMQKYPQQMFDGILNQEAGAMPFATGQQGIRYNLKQEPVETERADKSELIRTKNEMHMLDSEINRVDSQQSRLQQRLPQPFTRSSFPQIPWNNMGQPLDNSTRKEEHFQKRKSSQSPRVSAGGLPQSPLSSKSGEFSSGSLGAQLGAVATTAALGSSQREKSAVTSVPAVGGMGSLTSCANDSMHQQHQAQVAVNWRSNSLPKAPTMSGVGSPASVSNMSSPLNANSPVGKEADKSMLDRFLKIEMLTERFQLNCKKNKVDEYRKTTTFPTQHMNHHLFNDHKNDNLKDETCKMPMSKSLVGGSLNVCKTRVLNFVQTERVLQGNGFSLVPKLRTRMILSEKQNDGTVAMHYGELDDTDYLAAEECLPTLPNTHTADLLAAQFCSLMLRDGYHVEGDQLQPKPINKVHSSGGQPNNAPGGSSNAEMQHNPEVFSGQLTNELVKQSNDQTNSASINSSPNMPSMRMYPPGNSQALHLSQAGLMPGVSMSPSRPQQSEPQRTPQQQQQNQHSLMQQQLQRSSAMMLAANPPSHLGNHMLGKVSPLQLQLLQQRQRQQQQQQHPQMQRKMMMGLGNVGTGGSIGNHDMVGLQGSGNVMGNGGVRGRTGISPPMTGPISGMGNNMGQNPTNINQASSISNAISQQLRSRQLTPAETAMMVAKLRMTQVTPNMLGGPGGASSNISGLPGANRPIHQGSSGLTMLDPGINRANNLNPMQRAAMAPPKLIPGTNLYVNPQQQQQLRLQQQQQLRLQQQQQLHQQESTSSLQAVLSPPQQQVGSPSTGMSQQPQASPQQMNAQLSSGAVHPIVNAGNQEGTRQASPQLGSQTLDSVSSMANSPLDLQGVNTSS